MTPYLLTEISTDPHILRAMRAELRRWGVTWHGDPLDEGAVVPGLAAGRPLAVVRAEAQRRTYIAYLGRADLTTPWD